jgi:hypothetical protein
LNKTRILSIALSSFFVWGSIAVSAQSVLKSAGTAHSDTSYQYLSNKGTQAYKRGNLARAAKYFEDALRAAKEEKIQDDRLALLKTNLAATYRDEERYSNTTLRSMERTRPPASFLVSLMLSTKCFRKIPEKVKRSLCLKIKPTRMLTGIHRRKLA